MKICCLGLVELLVEFLYFIKTALSEMTCRKTRTKYLMLQIKTSAFGVSSIVTLL